MTTVFGQDYAHVYDSLQDESKYQDEVKFVIARVVNQPESTASKSLLDLGCGTGRHLEFFSQHFASVCGIDASEWMAQRAQQRVPGAKIVVGDARIVRLDQKFDVVTALFDVLSYQIANDQVVEFFESIATHLYATGVAVVDFWHLAGLIASPPSERLREGELGDSRFLRFSNPTVDWSRAVTTVNMRTLMIQHAKVIGDIRESHEMRAFLIQEIEILAGMAGLVVTGSGGWMTGQPASVEHWHAYVLLRHSEADIATC